MRSSTIFATLIMSRISNSSTPSTSLRLSYRLSSPFFTFLHHFNAIQVRNSQKNCRKNLEQFSTGNMDGNVKKCSASFEFLLPNPACKVCQVGVSTISRTFTNLYICSLVSFVFLIHILCKISSGFPYLVFSIVIAYLSAPFEF